MSSQTIQERLKLLIEQLGLTDSAFADACSISRPTLSLLLAGKNKKISDNQIKNIHDTFPNVSIMWLLFGEGPMIINDQNIQKDPTKILNNENKIDNGNQILDFKPDGLDKNEFSKEIADNHLKNELKNAIKQSIKEVLKDEEILRQIEIPEFKKRKVVKINIYYDDQTFETFIPGN